MSSFSHFRHCAIRPSCIPRSPFKQSIRWSSRPASDISAPPTKRRKVTLQALQKLRDQKTPITVLTAYDYPTALAVEKCQNPGIDILLVGDSLAMVACGYTSTNELTLQEMLFHCRSVARAAKTPLLVADMPFGTYHASEDEAMKNAIRLMQEGYMDAIKLEGGQEILPLVKRMTSFGIPVMGHVGLMPQRASSLSGYRVQGKTSESAQSILDDALALQDAGAFSLVLEAVPSNVAGYVTEKLKIPTIGIGAGSKTSGQVLVQHDMSGGSARVPKFCKEFGNLSELQLSAAQAYAREVKGGTFPEEGRHTYEMSEEEWKKFLESQK